MIEFIWDGSSGPNFDLYRGLFNLSAALGRDLSPSPSVGQSVSLHRLTERDCRLAHSQNCCCGSVALWVILGLGASFGLFSYGTVKSLSLTCLWSLRHAHRSHWWPDFDDIRHMTSFHARMCILGVKSPETIIWGIKPNARNIQPFMLLKLLHKLQPNFVHQ